MEEQKALMVKVECKRCKNLFSKSSTDIVFDKRFEDVNGRSIFITYLDCPHCQERHFVQIDDIHSREIKKKIKKMFIKLSVMRNKNISIPKQQQNKFNSLQNNLKISRFELMKQYEDSIVTDTETGEVLKLNFTIV